MKILGIGIDIVENRRIQKSIKNPLFKKRIYTSKELKQSYVVNNKVGAVEIEVQNGSNNDESNKGLLNQYVQANFGVIDTEKNWAGYKYWTIGEKQIYYYKIKSNAGEIIEGVAVTSLNYSDVLIEREN